MWCIRIECLILSEMMNSMVCKRLGCLEAEPHIFVRGVKDCFEVGHYQTMWQTE